jgi:hypothetical protein
MAELRHRMTRTQGDVAHSLFVCTVSGCGRTVVLDHVGGNLMVLTAGAEAVHVGFGGPASTPSAFDWPTLV